MARKKNSASSTSKDLTVAEKAAIYNANKTSFAATDDAVKLLRDITKSFDHLKVNTFDKDTLRQYMKNIGSNEKNLRNVSRFLYYNSHIYFRLVRFYSSMTRLDCRKVIPNYELGSNTNKDTFLKNYYASLNILENINLQNNVQECLERVFVEDVCYGLFFMDETGSFIYILDPDYCVINSRYQTGNFGFAIDMSYYNNAKRKKEMEWIGEPLVSMYNAYKETNVKYQSVPDEYCFCLKFRSDTWNTAIPPFVSLFNSIINLNDLQNIQAVADEQQIFKMIYMKMKPISGSKRADDFELSPNLAIEYFNRMLAEALPDYVAGSVIPGTDDLGVIDFSDSADTDTDRVENAQTTILNTSGGGMVLNTSKITTQAGFEAALKAETEFALSSIIPQLDGFVNMILINKLKNKAAKVKHFEVSVYTIDKFAESLLKANQYSFAMRLAYGTCLGFSEKDQLAEMFLENEVLNLPELMQYPLSSSFTQTGETTDGYTTEVGQGAPEKDAGDLSDAGSRSRDT